MKNLAFRHAGFGVALAVMLSACTGNGIGSVNTVPSANEAAFRFANGHPGPAGLLNDAGVVPVGLGRRGFEEIIDGLSAGFDRHRDAVTTGGIYAATVSGPPFETSTVYGYTNPNKRNHPWICTLGTVPSFGNIDVDGRGNLIVPEGPISTVAVYQGPGMCGPKVSSLSDPYGEPLDASSADALTSPIAVLNEFGPNGDPPGSISVCYALTYDSYCYENLTNPYLYQPGSVAFTNNCWASTLDQSGQPRLVYFSGCYGSGELATGYLDSYVGGLDIDKAGNLVSVSLYSLYVYKGCNPACTLVGGPFSLHGESGQAHLDKNSQHLVVDDAGNNTIDVYAYSPTSLTYLYSFNNGFQGQFTSGAAFNPRSKQ